MLVWARQDEMLNQITRVLNIVFLIIFMIEAGLKILTQKIDYFKDKWN